MDFSEVIGQQHLKNHLKKTIENGRIPHSQLFIGRTGTGLLPMALSYAREILCSKYQEDDEKHRICSSLIAKLSHPDLHFIFPVNTNELVKKNPLSSMFQNDWREFVLENPYASLYDWYKHIGIEKKQGNISAGEAEEISKKLSLKSFDGGYKVMIIWMAEKMNNDCANKILKIVEEPPENTVLILLAENEEKVLITIQSRCQKIHFPLLSEQDIFQRLSDRFENEESVSKKIAHLANGDYNKALQLLSNTGDDDQFEKWFISWVRTAFRAKGNKGSINDLLEWSEELARHGRETQKKFLNYCHELFRQAMLKNYSADPLIFFESKDPKFSIEKFAPFVHQNNIIEISRSLEEAEYHIERNGNAKIIFSDLSIKLTRLIHQKQ